MNIIRELRAAGYNVAGDCLLVPAGVIVFIVLGVFVEIVS